MAMQRNGSHQVTAYKHKLALVELKTFILSFNFALVTACILIEMFN